MPNRLLLETIKIEAGEICNLSYHQKRCNYSRHSLFHLDNILNLESAIDAPKIGIWRCRILYAKKIKSVEYIPYTPKKIEKLKIVPSSITYDFKYANRSKLNTLLKQYPHADEVIIEKEGLLTDTTIANIAFYDGEYWYTPKNPLLHGTVREKLLDEGVLHLRNIKKEDLARYSQVALMNAMIGFSILGDNTHIVQI